MDSNGTKHDAFHNDDATQRSRRVMFADEVGARGLTHRGHGGNDEGNGDTQQHGGAATHAAAGRHSAEGEPQHGDNGEHRGRKGKNNRRQRRQGGHAKAAAALTEALGLNEDLEENSRQLFDDYAMLLVADENAKRLSVEVLQMREQEEVYKTYRALRGMQLGQAATEPPRRDGSEASGSSANSHREGANDAARVDTAPGMEPRPLVVRSPSPARGRDAKTSDGPPATSGFFKWVTAFSAALTNGGAVCRHHVWKLLFFVALLFCRRLLLRSSPSS